MRVSNNSDKLDDRFHVEEAVLKISTHFIDAISVENAINLAIMEVGNLCKINNVFVFLFKDDKTAFNLSNEWSKTSSVMQKKIKIKPEEISRILNELEKDKPIQIEDINRLTQIEHNTKKFFESIEIHSLISFRLKIEDKLSGFLLLCSKEKNHEWS